MMTNPSSGRQASPSLEFARSSASSVAGLAGSRPRWDLGGARFAFSVTGGAVSLTPTRPFRRSPRSPPPARRSLASDPLRRQRATEDRCAGATPYPSLPSESPPDMASSGIQPTSRSSVHTCAGADATRRWRLFPPLRSSACSRPSPLAAGWASCGCGRRTWGAIRSSNSSRPGDDPPRPDRVIDPSSRRRRRWQARSTRCGRPGHRADPGRKSKASGRPVAHARRIQALTVKGGADGTPRHSWRGRPPRPRAGRPGLPPAAGAKRRVEPGLVACRLSAVSARSARRRLRRGDWRARNPTRLSAGPSHRSGGPWCCAERGDGSVHR